MVCFEFSFGVCYDCQAVFHLLLAEQGTKNLEVSIGFYLAFLSFVIRLLFRFI